MHPGSPHTVFSKQNMAIIDLPQQSVYLQKFKVTIPLILVNGRLGLDVSQRHEQAALFWFMA